MDKGKLLQMQLLIMASFYTFGTMFITLPRSLTELAQHTGWLCILIAMVLFIGYAYLLTSLILEMRDQNLVTFVHSILGKWIGPPVTLILLLFPTLFYSAYVMRLVMELFSTLVIPETPIEILMIMILILRYWVVHGGIRSLGNMTEILLPGIGVVVMAMLFLSIGHVEFSRNEPLFDTDLAGLFKGSLSVLSVYMEIGILLFMVNRIDEPAKTMKTLMILNVIVGILLIFTYWLCLGTFGTAFTKRLAFPTVEMIRNVSFGNFLEHIEIIFLATWVMMNLVKGAATYYACCLGFQNWFGLKSYRTLMLPIIVIIYFLAVIPQNLLQAVFRFEQFKSLIYPYYGLSTIAILLVIARIKNKKRGQSG